MINSLVQTVLKCTTPGVPDFYQGTMTWTFSLVDPDNRRPVDYAVRRKLLDGLAGRTPEELFRNWTDGAIKLFIIQKVLQFRRDHVKLFDDGTYEPLEVTGAHRERVIAFQRRHDAEGLVVVLPRFTEPLGKPVGNVWHETRIPVPAGTWRDVFTGRELTSDGSLPVSQILHDFPVACLASQTAPNTGSSYT